MNEHVILVAFHVTGDTFKEAQLELLDHLQTLPWNGHNGHASNLEAHWVAENERYDRSDNDSAVFIRGSGEEAARVFAQYERANKNCLDHNDHRYAMMASDLPREI